MGFFTGVIQEIEDLKFRISHLKHEISLIPAYKLIKLYSAYRRLRLMENQLEILKSEFNTIFN